MSYKDDKEEILKLIETGEILLAKDLLENIKNDYPNNYPYDVDIMYFDTHINLLLDGNLKKCEYNLNKIKNICPFHFHTNQLLAIIYLKLDKFKEINNMINLFSSILNLNENEYCVSDLLKGEVAEVISYILSNLKENNIIKDVNDLFLFSHCYFGTFPIENFLGKTINNYFIAKAFTFGTYSFDIHYISKLYENFRLECFKAYDNKPLINDKNYILPLHSIEEDTYISLFDIKQNKNVKFILNTYNYYFFNIKGSPELTTNKDIFIGNPIPCFKYENNKDLVITLFIDGLSQLTIEEHGGLEKLMPNTYKFFKDYLYFDNYYVCGEFTHVGVATYFTGQYSSNHKLLTPLINGSLNKNIKILSEYINDKNYFTSKIDGDISSNISYGYYRGFDHILYENSLSGNMTAKEIPSLLIDHIETFKDTNLYIHTCIPDLHDICDCFNLNYSIQTKQDYDEKPIIEGYDFCRPSVKNKYSEPKIKSYIRMIKYIDTHLNSLYSYLENNFDMDNVTIALISDHGQGFLIKPDEEFLSDGRLKVPLLIRSKEVKNMNKCSELVQNTDYIAIMDKLLNLNVNYKKIDANLPACLGGKAREYTYAESLFPSDPYRAFINIENYQFYFESKEKVQFDGRVVLDEYIAHLKDKSTKEIIENDEILKKCIDIVFEHMKYNRIYI